MTFRLTTPALTAAAVLLLLAEGTAPADSSASVRKSVIVPATVEDVWSAWTTTEGVETFLAPGARIDPRPGGAYEVWFFPEAPAGSRGCDGCTVISVAPPKKLSVTWSYPPSLPELRDTGAKGRVTVELIPASVEGATLVSLVHDGFPEGAPGEKGRVYFEKAWDVVLTRLQQRFRHGPVDWSKP